MSRSVRYGRGPAIVLAILLPASLVGQTSSKPRARDLGIPFDGTPGRYNAITDVAGVEVGHTTLISGQGALVEGKGPVRTGITAILPRGRGAKEPVFSAWFALNGNGEMTGTTWVDESGFLEGPVLITNTHSVGVVRDATIGWMLRHQTGFRWALPVVAETYDGVLNDINGFHVKPAHVVSALDAARGGPVLEGAVGGGTGMLCNGFKGGIGSSSRLLAPESGAYTVGILVQCNYGSRRGLRVAGIPVGQEFAEPMVCVAGSKPPSRDWLRDMPRCGERSSSLDRPHAELGSIIIVVATDAPLLPHQLERLVRRAALGLGREGSIASNYSGDIFIAFSTANRGAAADSGLVSVHMIPNEQGADSIRAYALPHDRLKSIMRKYNRVN